MSVVQAVARRGARIERDDGAGFAAGNVALIGGVVFELGVHNAVALGVRNKFLAVADEATGGNAEDEAGITAVRLLHG